MYYFIKKVKGFTLVELLIIIAIIGFLTSISIIVLDGVRVGARDTKRKADVNQILKAVEMHANSTGGEYPSTGGATYTMPSLKCLGLNTGESCFGGRHWGDDSLNESVLKYIIPNKDPKRDNEIFDNYLYSSACHSDHYSLSNEPCIYWQPEGEITAEACEPGGVGGSGSNLCGYSCQFCTVGVSNKK